MKHFTSIAFVLLCAFTSFAQRDSSFRLVKTFPVNAVDFAVDNLDNIYFITSSDQLRKLNAAGDSMEAYNNVKRFGKLSAIDVSNPLRVLLFYKDFATIAILDRFLTLRSSLDLRKQNIPQVSAIGLAYDNNIWVFDEYNNKLKKIDEDGNTQLETPDFRMLFNESIVPTQIIDKNNFVYLYDPNRGVYLFDRYGTYKKKLPITGWKNIAVINQYITGIQANSLAIYNTATLLQTSLSLPFEFKNSFSNYIIGNTKLFGLNKEGIKSYSIPY
ncbi:MAG: hypothetical protein C4330_06135 [Chitinophagaceae bacterium]